MDSYRALGRGSRSRVVVVTMMTALMLIGTVGTAGAATGYSIVIPIDTVIRAPEGSVTLLATAAVPDEAVGQVCAVVAHAANQRSVHPNNDLRVDSGTSQVVLPDVEGVPNSTVEASGPLTLGSSIEVSLLMGEDEVFSGGFDVVLECELQPGRVIVVKEVTEGSDTSQAFGFTADYVDAGFSLSDGEQHDSGDLEPGTYSVSEQELAGWTLESATCDDGSPVGAIEVSPGETVTCTFVNDQAASPEPGRVIVVKEVTEGADTSQAFGFTADYVDAGFSLSDGEQHDSGDLEPGNYSVSEQELAGWTLESATCDDGSPVGAIEVSPGETVTCTFVNAPIEDEVLASIVVTISAQCVVDDDEEVGLIDVGVSVAGGADVVVRDSDGDIVDSVSEDATLRVPAGSSYSWEATPNEGFEFPGGSATSGSVTIESCSDADVLPFTGPETDALAIVASILLASGFAILAFQPRRLES